MKNEAFTLVEIMVVVTLIAILASLAFPVYQKVRITTLKTTFKNDAAKLISAANQYYMDKGVTSVAASDLISSGKYIKALSKGNTLSATMITMDTAFTFEIGNILAPLGGLTFDYDGKTIGDPY
jgi:prepilin-type N-terminal cleavage/methylation domain-containing protein